VRHAGIRFLAVLCVLEAGTAHGEEWISLGSLEAPVIDLAIDDTYLYAATDGAGVFRRVATDLDAPWTPLGPVGLHVHAVWASGAVPGRVLVGNVFSSPDHPSLLYRSDDGGLTWTGADTGLDGIGVIALEGSDHDPDRMLAWTTNLFQSDDGGMTWHCVDFSIDYPCGAVAATDPWQILWDPIDGDRVWLTYPTGFQDGILYRSRDAGLTWIETYHAPDDPSLRVGIDATTGSILAAHRVAEIEEIRRSDDGGESWESVYQTTETLAARGILLAPWGRAFLFMGEDLGEGVLWASSDGGHTWDDVSDGLGLDGVNALVAHPDGLLFAAGDDGVRAADATLPVAVAEPGIGHGHGPRIVRSPARGWVVVKNVGDGASGMIVDAAGRVVSRVVEEGGVLRWNGTGPDARHSAPGRYFLVMAGGGRTIPFVWLGP